MTVITNPFDAGGFSLAEMTEAINLLPNRYGRVGQLGIFRDEGVTQRQIVIEEHDGTLSLLPSVPPGGPPTLANRDARRQRSFVVPHIPHDDVILPQDVQGIRAFGATDAADPLAHLMERRLARMRMKHGQTLEFMRVNALRGQLRDGAGSVLYDWHAEFGISQKTVDFALGSAGTEVQEKCREVVRHVETNLRGETMTGVHALVSAEFWDKLVKHASVKDAYRYYAATQGGQPLREDVRRGFPFAGVVFEEYSATVTLSTGAAERLVPANDGIAVPLGTGDAFVTCYAPANMIEAANTVGLPLYARQVARADGRGIDLLTESNPLPVVRRPALTVRIHSSN
ncbi:MAG: major capsid protein [Alphaproteobacteria bacterium]